MLYIITDYHVVVQIALSFIIQLCVLRNSKHKVLVQISNLNCALFFILINMLFYRQIIIPNTNVPLRETLEARLCVVTKSWVQWRHGVLVVAVRLYLPSTPIPPSTMIGYKSIQASAFLSPVKRRIMTQQILLTNK